MRYSRFFFYPLFALVMSLILTATIVTVIAHSATNKSLLNTVDESERVRLVPDERTPVAYGWIDQPLNSLAVFTGTIFALDGTTPLPDVKVHLLPGGYYGCSNDEGMYVVAGLPYGEYIVAASLGWNDCRNQPPSYFAEYFDNTDDPELAATLVFSSTSDFITDIDFNLEPAGIVTGTVYAADGSTPLSDVNVQLEPGGVDGCSDADIKAISCLAQALLGVCRRIFISN